ncbi:hypothetical protein ACRRQX_000841 [Yersinia enterocolitica]|uniref:Uncharacterized protein n=1 Tax=Yersinia enterocolitica LC20 TaxID=1443113 RepID=A0A7U4GG66_YEREN|nr:MULTISPECIES: hypothetical protein [Yersinia]AHM74502.2 hypothetical protein LC20_03249 [Yersinia hibernica]EKN3339178.1 hypothetical protein [Yersinia enterocolitica]EKN3340493.1 hypothetical protein [Yersinia enterocolitica]EKN4878533.1 hypothetical protein [Yersinia enterocolitica]EKN5154726.1 hypothetical protein [Yersinia enterocolitica]
MLKIKVILHILVIISLVYVSFYMHDNIRYQGVVDILSGLQNASAMIFAIVGIWLAYLYPNAISGLVKSEKIDFIASTKDTKRIESLVFIILASALVLIGVIFFYVISAIVKNTDFYIFHHVTIKTIGFAYVLYLFLIQCYAVFMIIIRNIVFINDLHKKLNEQKLKKNL